MIRLFLSLQMVVIAASTALAGTPVRLVLNWKAEPQFGGFYAASALKLDQKEGLDLTVQSGGAGTPVVQMVASGNVDFGIASADEVVVSRSNGSDVVALFATYQINPQAIMSRAGRGFKTLGDVFGSEGTIAMQKGLPYAIFLLKKYGSSFESKGMEMKSKIVPYVGGISNFMASENHSQQCFLTSEPLLAKSKGLAVSTFLVSESGYNPYTTVLITRSSFLQNKDHLKTAKALVRSVREGWTRYVRDSKVTESVNAQMFGINPSMDLETLRQSAATQIPLIDVPKGGAIGSMRTERWAELVEQLKWMSLIKKKPEAEDLFVNL